MNDKEYKDAFFILPAMLFSCVLFPAFCIVTIMFGYIRPLTIIIEVVLGVLVLPWFIYRTKFLVKYKRYTTKKRFLFETISYIACFVFAVGTGFLAKETSPGVIDYYFLNIYIMPAFIIYTFVLMGFMIFTAKNISKKYNEEKKRRARAIQKMLEGDASSDENFDIGQKPENEQTVATDSPIVDQDERPNDKQD